MEHKYPVVDKNNKIIGYACAENNNSPVVIEINDGVSIVQGEDYKILLPKKEKPKYNSNFNIIRCEHCKSLEMNARLFDDKKDEDKYWCHELDRNVYMLNYCGLGEETK